MPTRFGFDNAGRGFDQAPFGSIFEYRAVEADKTLSALSSSVSVQLRTPVRQEIQSSGTFGAPSATVAVQLAQRHAVTAFTTFAAPSATTSVQLRTPARAGVQASTTLGAVASAVVVNLRTAGRLEVQADTALGSLATTAVVQTYTPTRAEVQSSVIFGVSAATVAVQTYIPTRAGVQASITFATIAGVSTFQIRAPGRHEIRASRTFSSLSGLSAQLEKRSATRRAVTATTTLAVPSTAVTVNRRERRLFLSDFPLTGYTPDALAVIRRTESGNTFYRAAPRGGADTPIEGEVGIGPSNDAITWIRTVGNRLRLNDSTALSLTTYFNANAANLTIGIYTVDGYAEFPVEGNIASAGGDFINFNVSAAFLSLLADVDVGDEFIFGVLYPAVILVTASGTLPTLLDTVTVQKTAIVRRSVTAADSFAAAAATVAVNLRVTARREVQVTAFFATPTRTTTVQIRQPLRKKIQANGIFDPPIVDTVFIGLRSTDRRTVEASDIFSAGTFQTNVQRRQATRRVVTATITLSAPISGATIYSRTVVEASEILTAVVGAVAVQKILIPRHEVTATGSFVAPTSGVTVLGRISDRLPVEASTTFGAVASTVEINVDIPVLASLTLPVLTLTVVVQNRAAALIQVDAATTLSAVTPAAAVQKVTTGRHVLQLALRFTAAGSTTNVDLRLPTRRLVIATETFAAPTGRVSVAKRLSARLPVEAAGTFAAPSATTAIFSKTIVEATGTLAAGASTVTVQRQARARYEVQLAATTFGAASGAVNVAKRLSQRREVAAFETFAAAITSTVVFIRTPVTAAAAFNALLSTVVVTNRSATRREMMATRVLPEYVGTTAVAKRGINRHAVTAAAIFGALATTTAVNKRIVNRHEVQASATFGSVARTVTVDLRTAMEKTVEASTTFVALGDAVTVNLRATIRRELTFTVFVSGALTASTTAQLRVTTNQELATFGTFPQLVTTVQVFDRSVAEKSIEAMLTWLVLSPTVIVQKGVAMPPDIVLGLMLIASGYTNITIMWIQPGAGTGVLLHYEYRLDSGAWVSTMSASTEHMITGLMPGTSYAITVRAVSNVGRGPSSASLAASTDAVMMPSEALNFRAFTPGSGVVDLTWDTPENNGGDTITHYEIEVTDPSGVAFLDSTTGPVLRHRVRGLGLYQRYGFRVRARNLVGAGPFTSYIYATPAVIGTPALVSGLRIPLFDLDRQSLIVRIGGQDCRVQVWWQPSSLAWFAGLEVPVNSALVSGKRLTVNGGILDRLQGVLPGNIVCRAIDEDNAERDPARDSWLRQTHGLFWEAN